jgi:hypothetical protein
MVVCNYDTGRSYFQSLFDLKVFGNFSITELNEMIIYEKEIYEQLYDNYLKEKAKKQGPKPPFGI